jgi:hypothetical protein
VTTIDRGIAAAAAVRSARRADGRTARSAAADAWSYLLVAALVAGAWAVSRFGWFEAGDDVGYWIGVTGGTMMLLLFSYPLRKYVRVFHRWGKVKWWLGVHVALGLGGPLLILLHSTFRIGSLNAAVALYSMLVVAGSGIVGRFLYLHVNRGLHGELTTLRQLQLRAGLAQSDARSRLAFAPDVEARLVAFEQRELASARGAWTFARQVLLLPLQQRIEARACIAALADPLERLARHGGWSDEQRTRRTRLARKLVRQYLDAVVRVAQFSAYERLFALWHVAHVPFVYLLVISTVVHVVAVHAY